MTNSQLISRRELLVSLSASALLPYPAILSAAENKMRGALMILSTPYTDDNQVDFEDWQKKSDSVLNVECRVLFGLKIQANSGT